MGQEYNGKLLPAATHHPSFMVLLLGAGSFWPPLQMVMNSPFYSLEWLSPCPICWG